MEMTRKNILRLLGITAIVVLIGAAITWLPSLQPGAAVLSDTPVPTQGAVETGNQLASEGKLEEAFAQYNNAIQNNTDLAAAYSGRGNIFTQWRRFAEAANDYTASLQYNQSAEVLISRCTANRMLAKPEAAEADCNEAIELNPELGEAYLALAMLKLDQGNSTEAEEAVQAALEINPESATTYHVLFQIHLINGALDEAIETISTSIELDPSQPQYYWDRGFTYYMTGQIEPAKEDMRQLLEVGNPERDGELLLKAGTLLSSFGETP
jgi:tetratricopeptide (TPR) repeat protein